MTDALFDLTPDWSGDLFIQEAMDHGRRWTVQWHYSAKPPSSSMFYGAFCPDMAAVVAIGCPAGNAKGVAGRLGLERWPGNLEITRVVCHPDAPKNTASRSIAAVLKHIHRTRGVEWVFSFADTGQDHHGGIYQALNAVYCGLNGDKPRDTYRLNGVLTHPRTIVSTFGTQAWPRCREIAESRGMLLEKVPDAITPKHTYVLTCGGPAVSRAIRKALAPYAQPYPKRSA